MVARRGGSIVNIASIGGKVAVPLLLPYTASKFAEVGFSEGLHAELRHKGVHVEIAITPQAILASRIAHVAPEVTRRVMGLMNRMLPDPPEASGRCGA
jgi:short-subunit dehydrogenase